MIKKIYSIKDVKTEHFATPFMLHTKGEAIRAFSDETQNSDSPFHKHPSDYVLYELGSFDDQSGGYILHKTPELIGMASDFMPQS